MAGLITTTNQKLPERHARITLLGTRLLTDFPSGSSVEFVNGHIYLCGDDATKILVLDTAYNKVDSLPLFTDTSYRIAKAKKADIESSTLVNHSTYIMLGSGSGKERNKILVHQLHGKGAGRTATINTRTFNQRVLNTGIKEINYEGLASIPNCIVISNRGNNGYPVNSLVFTTANFWKQQLHAGINISRVLLPVADTVFAGISGLAYAPGDRLIFTASTEATSNAYDDGVIGDSYIGWFTGINSKRYRKSINADGFINLSNVDPAFKNQKIEGVCVQQGDANSMVLHLVADNDKGDTRLFKIKLVID